MLTDSEVLFCKEYHLSQSKNLDGIANNLVWSQGKVLAYKKRCEDKGYIVKGILTELALSNIKIIEELDVKGLK